MQREVHKYQETTAHNSEQQFPHDCVSMIVDVRKKNKAFRRILRKYYNHSLE